MTRRRTTRTTTQRPEAIATRAFNQLLAKHPVWAAVLLIVVAVGGWFFLRQDAGDVSPAAEPTTVVVSEIAMPPPEHAIAEQPAAEANHAAETTDETTSNDDTEQTDTEYDPISGLPFIAESELPDQANEILKAIEAGGPFEFPQDDTVFGNYERLLPAHPRGYYREHTVKMPWDSTRGAHRVVTGSDGEIYWTDDHYASFSVVMEGA